jgi:hypothetical protein
MMFPLHRSNASAPASLAVEIVLQFTPFAEEGTALAAMDWR